MIEKIKDWGFGVTSVEKELTNEEFLSKLYEADNRMLTNSLEGFEKLRQENEELKKKVEQLENKLEHCSNDKWYIDLEKLNIPEEIENQIRKQVCDEIRDKLKAHCDYTDEENIGWYLPEHKIDMLLDQTKKKKED